MSHMCKSCEYSCTHGAFVEFLQVVVMIITCITPPTKRRVTFSGLQFAMMTNLVDVGAASSFFYLMSAAFHSKIHDDWTCKIVVALVSF